MYNINTHTNTIIKQTNIACKSTNMPSTSSENDPRHTNKLQIKFKQS